MAQSGVVFRITYKRLEGAGMAVCPRSALSIRDGQRIDILPEALDPALGYVPDVGVGRINGLARDRVHGREAAK